MFWSLQPSRNQGWCDSFPSIRWTDNTMNRKHNQLILSTMWVMRQGDDRRVLEDIADERMEAACLSSCCVRRVPPVKIIAVGMYRVNICGWDFNHLNMLPLFLNVIPILSPVVVVLASILSLLKMLNRSWLGMWKRWVVRTEGVTNGRGRLMKLYQKEVRA